MTDYLALKYQAKPRAARFSLSPSVRREHFAAAKTNRIPISRDDGSIVTSLVGPRINMQNLN